MKISQTRLHQLFEISLWLKGAFSVLEIAGAAGLLFIKQSAMLSLAELLTRQELLEDPHDVIANFILGAAEHLSPAGTSFAAYYLLSHGAIKLILIVMVMRGMRWAYPLFMITLALLIAYQSYRLTHVVTAGLMALTLLDVVVLALSWHEYRVHYRSALTSSAGRQP